MLTLPPLAARLRDEIHPKVKPSVGPIFFAKSLEVASGNLLGNGTFGLVNTGKRKLLITCRHVVEDFRKHLGIEPSVSLCLGIGHTPDVLKISNLIDEDKSLDIATFDMTPLKSSLSGRKFFDIHNKTAPELKKDVMLFVVGYPKRHRIEFDQAIYWGTTPHLFRIADVTQRSIYVETHKMVNLLGQRVSEVHENPYGGVSGSLCFAVDKTFTPFLVGIVSEHGFDVLAITRLECLKSDGSLTK